MRDSTKQLTDQIAEEYKRMALAGNTAGLLDHLAEKFNISKGHLRRYLSQLRKDGRIMHLRDYTTGQDQDVLDKDDPTKQHVEVTTDAEGNIVAESKGPIIKTAQQLVDACDIDLDVWDITHQKARSWTTPVKLRGGDGKDRLEHIVNYGVVASFTLRKPRERMNQMFMDLCDNLGHKAAMRNSKLTTYEPPKYDACCYEIGIYDFHLGVTAWDKENGENWDTTIARIVWEHTIRDLVTQAKHSHYTFDKVIMPIGNDFIHCDGIKHTTTAGTQMHMDDKAHKLFLLGVQMQQWAIEHVLKELKAPVEVIVVPGNHDEATMFYMGEVLKAIYRSHPNVTINNEPALRKYIVYGNTLLGYTHGKYENINDLPMIAANEVPKLWGKSKWREIHVGHTHHRNARSLPWRYIDTNGCLVRTMPTLIASDEFHSRNGLTYSTKAAEALVYDKHKGYTATFSSQRTLEY